MSPSTVATPSRTGQPMAKKEQATGLVPAGRVVEGEIVTAEAYNTQITRWKDSGFNVLTPAASLSSIPRDHKMLVQQVQINPDPTGGEVYKNPLFTRERRSRVVEGGTREGRPGRRDHDSDEIVRVDSRTVEHVYTYRVTGHWLGFDGNVIAADRAQDARSARRVSPTSRASPPTRSSRRVGTARRSARARPSTACIASTGSARSISSANWHSGPSSCSSSSGSRTCRIRSSPRS
jgi:hypothetical protein